MARLYPFCARADAIALPIPLVAPVITAFMVVFFRKDKLPGGSCKVLGKNFRVRYLENGIRYGVFDVRYGVFDVRYGVFAIRYGVFAIRYGVFAIRHGVFAIRYGVFAIRH